MRKQSKYVTELVQLVLLCDCFDRQFSSATLLDSCMLFNHFHFMIISALLVPFIRIYIYILTQSVFKMHQEKKWNSIPVNAEESVKIHDRFQLMIMKSKHQRFYGLYTVYSIISFDTDLYFLEKEKIFFRAKMQNRKNLDLYHVIMMFKFYTETPWPRATLLFQLNVQYNCYVRKHIMMV